MTEPAVSQTPIPGLLVVTLALHEDRRGWFKENWQRAAMTARGLPDFGPVQQNVAFNAWRGVTRGFHAEPWDKYVSVATGRVFGAWVDLRRGPFRGTVHTREFGPDTAVFVPRGVANAYQSLEAETAYTYLVNEHWDPDADPDAVRGYPAVGLRDPDLAIEWPIPLDRAVLSDADRAHPPLSAVGSLEWSRTLVLGAGGQLGTALLRRVPGAIGLTRADCDLGSPRDVASLDLAGIGAVVNAAAYTRVDEAETSDGRRRAWAVNVAGVGALTRRVRARGIPLVHVSSDYVFDGTANEHDEEEPASPLGVYGQTKAAGDALVAGHDQHYIVRTSWVVGGGANFVRTMTSLADGGRRPAVVHDQRGRLTFAPDLADAIAHLLSRRPAFGTYNVTNAGPAQSWAQIARDVFELRGRSRDDVTGMSTAEYRPDAPLAARPASSVLNLAKIERTGYTPPAAAGRLREYVRSLPGSTQRRS